MSHIMDQQIFNDDEFDFILRALNAYWNDAHTNLQRKDLGNIERENYEYQLKHSKDLMTKVVNRFDDGL